MVITKLPAPETIWKGIAEPHSFLDPAFSRLAIGTGTDEPEPSPGYNPGRWIEILNPITLAEPQLALPKAAKKKPLKVKGDFDGSVGEDGLTSDTGALKAGKKKLKTTESFASSEAGVALGTFTANDGKTVAWTYTLGNSLAGVQALGAHEAVHETYHVTFKSKGAKATTKDVVVTITGVNDAPELTQNNGGPLAVALQENGLAVTTLTAHDIDHGAALTYSIVGGFDAAKFQINATSGVLSFVSAPNFEAPTDFNGDNNYEVMVLVSDGSLTDAQAVVVVVGNANEAPVITSNGGEATAEISAAENGTAVTTVTSSDPDASASRTYTIVGGADEAKFEINASSGVLSFVSAPDFEAPTDTGANNRYEVIVRVSDGSLSDVQTLAVTVTNVNEGPNTAPEFGDDSVLLHIPENTTAVATVYAYDNEDDHITYSLVDDQDSDYFTVDAETGVLRFINAPDYESVSHAAIYYVTVVASDGSLTADKDFAIFVDDVNENGRTVFNLATLLPSEGFVIQGDAFDDRAGFSVGSGDVNGDGYSDLIVGAQYGDDGGTDAGETYVIFGKSGAFGSVVGGRSVVDLTNDNLGTDGFAAADGFFVRGDAFADRSGHAVTSAGDVNADGYEDLIIGAYLGDDGANAAGEAYIAFGKASGFGTVGADGRAFIDTETFAPATGFVIMATTVNEQAGFAVSAAGDINGDGFDDLLVGARYADNGATNSGAAYVIFGKATSFGTVDGTGRAVVNLGNTPTGAFDEADGFIVAGDSTNHFAGRTLALAGDVNGDGLDDIIVGANAGRAAYVVFGKTGTFGNLDSAGRRVVDLASDDPGDGFDAGEGFVIMGQNPGGNFAISVSGAGDINGDGFADVVVGANLFVSDGGSAGWVYVVFGKASGFGTVDAAGRAVIDVTNDNPGDGFNASQGFIIRADQSGDRAGTTVSGAGDVNGDGYGDLLVGAPGADDGGSATGSTYVIFGKSSGFGTIGADGRATIDLTTLNPSEGFVIAGDFATSGAVSAAGDVNRDGFADIIIGAGDLSGNSAFVFFGSAFGASTTPVINTSGSAGNEIFMGALGDDTLGGGGGLDVFHSGKGDDRIIVPDLSFRVADGGLGTDTLVLTGSGQTFDFTTLGDARVVGIEAIDFSGTGANTLKLGLSDVLHFSDNPHAGFTGSVSTPKAIVIDGDSGDTVQLAADARGTWTKQADDRNLDGTAGGIYDLWSFQTGSGDVVKLAVDADIGVALLP